MTSGVEPDRRGRPSLARKARELMEAERLFAPGSRALIMVSGGQDSLALLHLLASGSAGCAGPASVCALHVNHHLRGYESDADQALVAHACAALGVELAITHRPIDKRMGNVQEEARAARRGAALAVAQELGCEIIVLGHTVDDQVETMLYRLGRYGGLAAFRGMTPRDPPWVRPLLGCRREETARYCHEHGLDFAEDRGNVYPGYARTGIREQVLPAWEASLPGAVDAAARAAEVATEMEQLIATVLADAGAAVVGGDWSGPAALGVATTRASANELSVARLLQCGAPLRRLLLHRWIEGRAGAAAPPGPVRPGFAQRDVPGSAERAIGGGWRARKEYDRLYLEHGARASAPVVGALALPLPGEVEWGGLRVRAERVERFSAPDPKSEAYVDARSLSGPLLVRGPLPGDRVRPLGAPGTRKLQDVMVDLRVPAAARDRTPLVVSGGHIVWVCGLVVAEKGRIARDTTALVRFSLGACRSGHRSGEQGRHEGGRNA